MGQIYPTPSSFGQSLTINTSPPLTGGGPVSLGGSLTLGLSTSNSSTRLAYVVTPAPDGTVANFTIVGLPSGSDVSYADVFVDGKLQLSSAFNLSGSTLSLNTPPTVGQKVRVVCSTPTDSRQQYTLASSSSTVFTFPSVSPQSTYVDIYDGNGKLQTVGATGYYLNITNGSYSVVFASAPTTPIVAVFDPSVNSGRNLYATTPITSTTFSISGGSPSTSYIDVFDQGLFLMDGSSYDYTLSYTSGSWIITFASAPVAPVAVFAPATVVPPSQSIGSVVNTLNTLSGDVTLSAGTNITLIPSGNTITIASSSASGVSSLNSLTGALSLTSTGGTVAITPSGSTINLEATGGGGYTSGYNPSLGYWQKDPTGLIRQWGIAYLTTYGVFQTFTFPTSFTNFASISIVANDSTGAVRVIATQPISLSTYGLDATGGGAAAYWQAIGY